MRLLLDPTAPAEGVTPPAPANPATTPPPAAAPKPDQFTPEVLRELLAARDRLAQIEAEHAQKIEDERQKAIKALADKGQIETAFAELRKDHAKQIQEREERAARLESQILATSLKTEVTQALSSAAFLDGEGAAAARALVSQNLEPARDPATGQVVVRDRTTGLPAAESIAAWLKGPVAARLLAPPGKGGSGFAGSQPVPTPDPNAAPPTGEAAVIARWQAAQQAAFEGPVWMRPRAAAPRKA